MEKQFKQACKIHTHTWIIQYLLSNSHGQWNGALKSHMHSELCKFYVAVFKNCEEDAVRRHYEPEYKKVHKATQKMTDHMDEIIGFPLDEQPDYDIFAPLFFEHFHHIACEVLG